VQQQMSQSGTPSATAGTGWLEFAGVMTVITGAFNVFDGLVAFYRTSYFRNVFLFGNLRFWAGVFVVFGVVQLLAGFAILARQGWGRWFAMLTVGLNAFAQLLVIGANPWWSSIIILYDVVIFYALAVHWGRRPVVAAPR
jgi:hypothetical protein